MCVLPRTRAPCACQAHLACHQAHVALQPRMPCPVPQDVHSADNRAQPAFAAATNCRMHAVQGSAGMPGHCGWPSPQRACGHHAPPRTHALTHTQCTAGDVVHSMIVVECAGVLKGRHGHPTVVADKDLRALLQSSEFSSVTQFMNCEWLLRCRTSP